ncbi:MAG: TM2 domain-containing protein [Rhizobiales bacterium]|nr:TM2 domain-containing protein [Hyphomicrobiales bacterium]
MALSTEQKLLIETRVANEAPNAAAAYLLWFFLGWVSAHRFYLGRPGTAILQILSYFILIGFVWWLIDVFLIPGMIRARQQQLREQYARTGL